MDPLSRGRECYKKKDYKGALEAFNEASSPSNTVALYSHNA
jgi:hypothetical protein